MHWRHRRSRLLKHQISLTSTSPPDHRPRTGLELPAAFAIRGRTCRVRPPAHATFLDPAGNHGTA